MTSNESYDLAEAYVTVEINRKIRWLDSSYGPELQAVIWNMQRCDCIPTDVTDKDCRVWVLVSVHRSDVAGLVATYKLRG